MLDRQKKELAQSRLKSQQPGVDTQPALREATQKTTSYTTQLPTLGLGVFFLIVLIFFVTQIYPPAIANMVVKNSFLPLVLCTFLASLFLASYAFLNTRKGLLFSLWLTLLLWSQLANALPLWIALPAYTIWFGGIGFVLQKLTND